MGLEITNDQQRRASHCSNKYIAFVVILTETDSEVESVDSFDDAEGLGLEECLFCSHINVSMEDNIKHMTLKHTFFLPDADYISDLEGLITYLGNV